MIDSMYQITGKSKTDSQVLSNGPIAELADSRLCSKEGLISQEDFTPRKNNYLDYLSNTKY
ncbi:MAG: hypothetical protein PHR14_05210 [Oscillospiraceae bacterium]|nr:hypothetical protein [Oscillospiraceae bacterium]